MFVSLLDQRGVPLWYNYGSANPGKYAKHPFFDDVHKDDVERVEAIFGRVIVRGASAEFNLRAIVEGRETTFHSRLYPIDGRPVAICLFTVLEDKRLTEAEIEVMNLLSQDNTIKEIASITQRSESAIDARIKSLKNKLGVTTLHGIVAEAMRLGLTRTGGPRPESSRVDEA